jgi:hypothetical protein
MSFPKKMLGGEARPHIEAIAIGGKDGSVQETYPYLVELIAVVTAET